MKKDILASSHLLAVPPWAVHTLHDCVGIQCRLPEYLDPGGEHLHLLLTGALVQHRGHRPLHLRAPALVAGRLPDGVGDGGVGAGEQEARAEGRDPRVRAEVGHRRQQSVGAAPVAARPLLTVIRKKCH